MILTKLLGSVLGRPVRAARARRALPLLERGETALQRGEVEAAGCAFEAAASIEPPSAAVHHRIAAAYLGAGLHREAQTHLERCIALDPRTPEPYCLLGNLHRLSGELACAEQRYREALELDADVILAHCNLALLLRRQARIPDALQHFKAAHALAPLRGEMLREFVMTLLDCGEYATAGDVAQRAAEADPARYESWFCLGLARQQQHRSAEALAGYDHALALTAGDADLLTQRAMTLHELGQLPEALADYDAALALRPGDPLARFHKSLSLLLTEDYARAWPDYETRLLSEDVPYRPRRYPRWDGAPTTGRTVLVYGEQGLGDEIMFASCLPDLMRSGARCVIECHASLRALFADSFPDATVYATPTDRRVPDAIDALGIDWEVPIGSLAMYYRARAADFPHHQGYLKARPERVAAWRERLSALGPGPKIGLSWRGGTHRSREPLRSIELPRWQPIFDVPGPHFVSLQYTPDAPQALHALAREHGVQVAHWPEALADYAETAALVTALDFTITVCTSIVHLAGALGRPVWVMAPYTPEWRYGRSGEALRWYPSARMFRQHDNREWQAVIAAVAARLAQGGEE